MFSRFMPRPVVFLAAGFIAALVAGMAQTAPPEASAPVRPPVWTTHDFESGLGGWCAGPEGCKAAVVSGWRLARAGKVVELRMKGRRSATLRLPGAADISGFRSLRFDAFLRKMRGHAHFAVYFVDEDERWFQTWRRFTGEAGRWSTIEVDLRSAAGELLPVGHAQPWGPYAARGVREIGLRVFSDRPVRESIFVDNIRFVPRSSGPAPQRIYNFETSGDRVGRYEKFEITFELSRFYENPFDPSQIEIWGRFRAPSGNVADVPGFFYQAYERRIDRKVEHLTPAGSPKWKIRFTPRELGEYTYEIEVCDGETLRTSPRRFTCVASASPGCVGVCVEDPRYFEFENGTFFYPIGHNIPATFNIKGAEALRLAVNRFEGTYAYDRFLDGMARGKENFARLWLGSWSFALEWTRSYHRSYRDLGRYNLENAWRLDYVLDKAERLGIYVQVALTTFGHFRSQAFEGDWPYSPYNVRNGGSLSKPEDFWVHKPSQETYQRMVRYAMARWGYSTHVAAWEVCNEIDLVTAYKRRRAEILKWHERCVGTIRRFDQNPHLITTNFALLQNDPEILQMPEISYSATNHYAVQIVAMMRKKIFPARARLGKPAIMAEYGYDFKGALPDTTKRYLHICLWSSYMIPFGGAGLSWWWDFIDDRDLYPMFRPLAEYAEGEDRRNRNLEMSQGVLLGPDGRGAAALIADILQNDRSAYFWIYERRLLRAEADPVFTPEPRKGILLRIAGLADGDYYIEFWDTVKGGRIGELTARAENGTLQVAVPDFTSDIAGKVKPAGAAGPDE